MTDRLAHLLGTDVPIVLGPFGGLSSIELTAAVSNGGGLGSYGLYGYTPDRIRDTDQQLRAATRQPYALNLWLPTGTERDPSPAEFAQARSAVAEFFMELDLPLPEPPEHYLPSFDEQIETALELAPAAISFVYGVPPANVIVRAHDRGTIVIGTATTVDEAIVLQAGGVDVIVATGAEAAGHRVSFFESAGQSLVGTFALIPQVVDAVTVPVIAAGGIADRRGVAAAFALGAVGVQVGTTFLNTRQSAASDAHRKAIADTPAHGTVLTRAMSGRLARGPPTVPPAPLRPPKRSHRSPSRIGSRGSSARKQDDAGSAISSPCGSDKPAVSDTTTMPPAFSMNYARAFHPPSEIHR